MIKCTSYSTVKQLYIVKNKGFVKENFVYEILTTPLRTLRSVTMSGHVKYKRTQHVTLGTQRVTLSSSNDAAGLFYMKRSQCFN